MRTGSERGNAGFTLVELLVVIGIIALLISILLPMLSRARRAAEQSVCLSNVRQLAMADLLYANDNRGVLCPVNPTTGGGPLDIQTMHGVTGPVFLLWFASELESVPNHTCYFSWKGGYLGKYFQSDKALQCPSLKLELQQQYGYTDFPVMHYAPSIHLDSAKIARITVPSETVAFADVLECSWYDYYASNIFQWPVLLSKPSSSLLQAGSVFQGRHLQNRGGVSFLDGHAELIPVAMRDPGTYSGTQTLKPVTYQAYLALHLGELVPPNMKITDTSSGSYQTNAAKRYDYYFWANKLTHSF